MRIRESSMYKKVLAAGREILRYRAEAAALRSGPGGGCRPAAVTPGKTRESKATLTF